ncbi:YhcN/YlaJ family sporulation lipoprotein [Pseudalkalibacillus sp. SCS-8]|uniref:YhcN/YlaJ family sporulation lipoprotein n=1 Tax=Pseudalkalibacillus nanhaiensis TaxID=3115291 RepID=UPI0032DBD6DB
MLKKIVAVLFVLQLLAACNFIDAEEGQEYYSDPTQQNFQTNKNGLEDTPIVKRTSAETANAQELVQLAEQVEGVKNARAIVSGIYIVVGTDLKEGAEEKQTVKAVYERLSGHSHGANALVTTNEEHLKTLDEWGKAITSRKITENIDIYNGLGVMISEIKPNEDLRIRKSNPSKEYLDRHQLPDIKK